MRVTTISRQLRRYEDTSPSLNERNKMAKVLGETARYVTGQAIKKFQQQFTVLFLSSYIIAIAAGYLAGVIKGPYFFIPVMGFIIAVPFILKYSDRITGKLEKERMNFRKGATGEARIGYVLESFPDEFRVIHDLTTPYGNVDHVVIGPTGAYIIDTKNWKGVVSADGNGELLLNGKPTDKQEVRNLTRRIMSIRDKIKVLASMEPYIQGIFAFPSARVDANWGTTGHVNCVKDEQLYDYIVENKKSKKLSQKEIDSISRAFLELARMDKDFGQNSK